jgi:hypothetical protein
VIEFCDVFVTVKETGDHGSFNSWGRDRYWRPTIAECRTGSRTCGWGCVWSGGRATPNRGWTVAGTSRSAPGNIPLAPVSALST